MSDHNDKPNKCPACKSTYITGTLSSWICADCGATKEKPSEQKKS